MSDITLDGITYILEAVGDVETPAHDYDNTLDVDADKTVDEVEQWFAKIETEWDDMPKEIQIKVADKIMELSDNLGYKIDGHKQLEEVNEAVEDLDNGLGQDPAVVEAQDPNEREKFDHDSGLQKFMTLDIPGLQYSYNDITKAIESSESIARSGNVAPKLGYYWDEYWALLDAVKARRAKGEVINLAPWGLGGASVNPK